MNVNGPHLSAVLNRLKGVSRGGKGFMALCPAHDDHKPSLSITEGLDGQVLLHCFAGCDVTHILSHIGLTIADIGPSRTDARRASAGTRRFSVYEFSLAKRLPVDFLAQMGLQNCPQGVQITYRLEDGSVAPRQRIRTAAVAGQGSYWTSGSGQLVPYGLWRIDAAHRAGYMILCEGESDALTFWFHGFPAMGIPGAGHADLLERSHLQGVRKVYLIREPDRGGTLFLERVQRRLFSIGYSGQLFEVKFQGRKDPNELHRADTNGFKGAFRSLLDGATYIRLGDPDAPPEWEVPAQLHDPELPTFPTEVLPGWVRRSVDAVAMATQTPPDMAAMLALAAIATACAGKVEIQVKPDYREPLNIFVIVALPPGNRKSTVFAEITRPIREYERDEIRRMGPEIAGLRTRYQIEESQLKHLQDLAAKAKGAESETAKSNAEAQAERLAAMKIPSEPCFIVDDCTPERLASRLYEQGGRIAILSPEADVFELMAGRYSASGGPNLGVYLKGHAGDGIRVDRIGRASQHIDRPSLTLGLAVQPAALQGLTKRPGFHGRGLLGRFLYALPPSPLGTRNTEAPPVPVRVRQEYHDKIASLMGLPLPAAHTMPGVLVPDEPGLAEFREFDRWLEPKLAEFGELGHMTDWAGKLLGVVARVAGLLHMAEHSGDREPSRVPVAGSIVRAAKRIAYYLIQHAKAAYAEMGADPVLEDAKYILRWIKTRGVASFSRRDLHQATRGRFKKVEALEPSLSLLVSHGYIRDQAAEDRPRPGRRQSPTYDVNPRWLAQDTHNTQRSHACGGFEDSEYEPSSRPPDKLNNTAIADRAKEAGE